MKKLIIKYSIEFFVIVFSISISFFVENLREQKEKESKRQILVKNLLSEIESNDDYVKEMDSVYRINNEFVRYLLKDSLTVEILKTYPRYSPANPFLSNTGFNPTNSIYSSIINDGSLNLIESPILKAKIDELYKTSFQNVLKFTASEEEVAKAADNLFISNYSELYLRNFWNNFNDRNLMSDFIDVIKTDSKFKALMMQKLSFMEAKSRELNNYITKRDSLKIYLKLYLND